MKRPNEKYNDPKYLRAYLTVLMEQLARMEAKLDIIQYDICKDGPDAGLKFLDPKRKRNEKTLSVKYSDDTRQALAVLLSLIDAGKKKSVRRP